MFNVNIFGVDENVPNFEVVFSMRVYAVFPAPPICSNNKKGDSLY